MNGKKLWIQFWTERDKQRKKNNCIKGLQFLQSYTPQGHSVLLELLAGLEMTLGGRWNSGYKVIMPSDEMGYRRVRLANHPFELSEWPIHEEDGLPNERYSIFIYNEKTCPQFANVPETDWRSEYSEGVPIYEKGFNERYIKRLLPKLLRILALIYQGGVPQPDKLPLKIEESKINKNMKKNTIKLNEDALRQIVAESVKKVLKEHAWASASTFKELQNVLDEVTGILSKFSNSIPQEHSDEFMKLAGREWNDLWGSLSSLEETVMHINNPRGLSDGDLTFDDLS